MKGLVILSITTWLLIPFYIYSQTSDQIPQQQKQIALVIGNGNYLIGSLANPENDARAMKIALQNVGFDVIEYENLNQSEMKRTIDEFGEKMKSYDVGLFYYAGHGIQSNGYNYLIPVNAQLTTEKQVEYDCVQADRVLALMESSGTKVNIIILDACRNNPFERSWTRSVIGRGLAFMNAPAGTLIAYATSPGSTASDGSGKNGLYTSAILESIQIPNITILQMFQNVRKIVVQKSDKHQIPWESTSLIGDFYFKGSQNSQVNYLLTEDNSKIISETYDKLMNTGEYVDSRDGNKYKWVKIGSQVWMAENLKYLPSVCPPSQGSETNPYYYVYDYIGTNISLAKSTSNYRTYGVLYNWSAARIACPSGWHLPDEAEWLQLTDYLGGEEVAGGKLKETGTNHWISPNIGATNECGFTALPGGCRYIDLSRTNFSSINYSGYWWSFDYRADFTPPRAWQRGIFFDRVIIYSQAYSKEEGNSIRCIRDN